MKKKEIDLFNILLGLIIGCVLGYFIFTQIKPEQTTVDKPTIKENIYGTIYTLQLGCSSDLSSLNSIKERLDILDIYYEIYEEGGKYYIFNSIYSDINEAQSKKTIIENYGFTVSLRSDYILDLPNNMISSPDKYNFYTDVIKNLLNSLNDEDIIIANEYYSNPIDIQLFSNITILMTIKNDEIKENYQLNTFCLLLKKLK